jgi:16S rRNA G966 N2-methylase RsmD
VIDKLGAAGVARLVEGDALAALAQCACRGERFPLVFLDPLVPAGVAGAGAAPAGAVLAPTRR